MITVFLRTFIIYIILIAAMRLTGKRQIGELQISELAITFMLSELAVIPICDKDAPLSHALVPIILLISLEVIFSFLQTKSHAFKKMFSGSPALIISHGKLRGEELAKNRLDIEELLGELRQKGAFDIADVEYAYLEENGKISVLMKSESSPMTPSELGIKTNERGSAHPIVIDGKTDSSAMQLAGKNMKWLKDFLSRKDIELDSIFLMTVDDAGRINLYLKKEGTSYTIDKEIHLTNEKTDTNKKSDI